MPALLWAFFLILMHCFCKEIHFLYISNDIYLIEIVIKRMFAEQYLFFWILFFKICYNPLKIRTEQGDRYGAKYKIRYFIA